MNVNCIYKANTVTCCTVYSFMHLCRHHTIQKGYFETIKILQAWLKLFCFVLFCANRLRK